MKRFIMTCGALLLVSIAARADDFVIDGLKSKIPDSWKKGTAGSMETARFSLPKAEGDSEDAAVLVFFFGPGGGGGAEANVARWKGMFKPPAGEKAKVEKSKVGDVEVTTVDVTGTYLFKAKPIDQAVTEKPDFRMIGVVFASKNGPYFMRFIGPAKTVEKHKKEFDGWLKGFK